jgi:hypothetical protein
MIKHMSRSCIVTIWEKQNEKGEWEHNHLDAGFVDGKFPKMKDPTYENQKGWSRGTWRKSFAYITDDDKLEPIPSGPPTDLQERR